MKPLELLQVAIAAQRGLHVLRAGNPYHDAEGKFSSGSGGSHGHGKHYARRKRKLERLRKAGHKEIAEFRAHHKGQWRELLRDQKKEWGGQKREHVKERNQLRREHVKDKTKRSERRSEHADLREQQRDERKSLKSDHTEDRTSLRETHHDERREVIDRLKGDIYDAGFRKRVNRSGASPTRQGGKYNNAGSDSSFVVAHRRFSRGRTHKASSAESILKHALRQRGWSKQWRRGELTGKQHLSLLEDIRQYGRAWLRHEAEAFFDMYGVDNEQESGISSDTLPSIRGLDGGMSGVRELVTGGVGTVCDAGSDHAITRGLAQRAVSAIGRFFDRARQFVRELVVSGAMALKGNEPLSTDELTMLDRQARIQAEYLERFQKEVTHNPPIEIADIQSVTSLVEPAPMTPGQFVARAELYGNSVWQATVNTIRATTIRAAVMREERRILGQPKGEHCHDCPPLAALGWQPLGTLPAIGDTECGNLCLCAFEFRDLKQPAIPKLPGTGGPPEKPQKPPRGSPPKGKPPKPEPGIKLPGLQEAIDEAKKHGHTFEGTPGKEAEGYETF